MPGARSTAPRLPSLKDIVKTDVTKETMGDETAGFRQSVTDSVQGVLAHDEHTLMVD